MSRVEEVALLVALAVLALIGGLLWLRQGDALWLQASAILCA